mmetsp:Transcript_69342/g.166236  ORF Transcript_69342/g.166236 Transcript_69342/m.166236 type:complete len:269 (+) Transcript_69342:224-1030(+)
MRSAVPQPPRSCWKVALCSLKHPARRSKRLPDCGKPLKVPQLCFVHFFQLKRQRVMTVRAATKLAAIRLVLSRCEPDRKVLLHSMAAARPRSPRCAEPLGLEMERGESAECPSMVTPRQRQMTMTRLTKRQDGMATLLRSTRVPQCAEGTLDLHVAVRQLLLSRLNRMTLMCCPQALQGLVRCGAGGGALSWNPGIPRRSLSRCRLTLLHRLPHDGDIAAQNRRPSQGQSQRHRKANLQRRSLTPSSPQQRCRISALASEGPCPSLWW